MIIYIDTPLKAREKERINKYFGDSYQVYFTDEFKNDADKVDAISKADVLFGNPKPALMAQAVSAKWIQLFTAGFEYYQDIKTEAIVTNMDDYYSQPCAETMVGGMMALYRKMDVFGLLKEKKEWIGAPIRLELKLLEHKKVIILGTGNIGRRVAKILKAFDMEILFFGRTAKDAAMRTSDELTQKIPWADFIIGCLPGTSETKGLFTKEMIEKMNETAVFCNVGRGNLVADEDALIRALMDRKIGGAVLDVTASEPIPADSKLWVCPNTILSQHSGGGQESEYTGLVELFLENFENFKEGLPLKNRISFQKGY
ncbi:MAG: D-2-hydroxyacid dehydrogenase [Chitinophagaceae bacterium]